jgi:CelD/BcsL family acetyltransferase involved in cellulose biosynthesis
MLMRRTRKAADLVIAPAPPHAFDAAVAAADPAQAFLRHAWFAAQAGTALRTLVVQRPSGLPLAAIPARWAGPGLLRASTIPGSYWPFRSVPIAADATDAEIVGLLQRPEVRSFLGFAWRMGPVFDSDPAASRLLALAPAAGWTVLTRPLGTCFEIDVASLAADGPWPRASTLKKNRWREKKLAELGPVETRRFTGLDWAAADRDALAAIERNSWLAREAKAGFQFADAAQRRFWEQAAADPAIAAMIRGATLHVGGIPAAFSFALQVGKTRYQIANNYAERFASLSPGRTLLVAEFQEAVADGTTRISWGSGDAGYKTEMGATAGPKILDLLFVRPAPLAALLRRWWERPA